MKNKMTWFILICLGLMQWVQAGSLVGSRPNIVMVMTDDQGYQAYGRCNSWVHTPNLDRMAEQSVRFEKFVVSPTCSPTRAAVMTGRYPMESGVTHTIAERERMSVDLITLPQVLAKGGYATGMFGKWHLGDADEYQPINRGFDEVCMMGAGGVGQGHEEQRERFGSCADAPNNTHFDPIVRHNGKFKKASGYITDVWFSQAMGFMKKCKDKKQPFFVYLPTNAPHGPQVAPESFVQRYLDFGIKEKVAHFYGQVENIDYNMGRLMDTLEKWGMLENTLVIFFSDNGITSASGMQLQTLGKDAAGNPIHLDNMGLKGDKGSLNDGGVRVPCYWYWKGRLSSRSEERLGAHIDLLPTLADLADVKTEADWELKGRSLLPILESSSSDWSDRFIITHGGRWQLGKADSAKWIRFAVRNQRFRLVGKNALYDLDNDSAEKNNVIAEHPELAKSMLEAYEKWWDQTRPLMINEDIPVSKVQPYRVGYYAQEKAEGIPQLSTPDCITDHPVY